LVLVLVFFSWEFNLDFLRYEWCYLDTSSAASNLVSVSVKRNAKGECNEVGARCDEVHVERIFRIEGDGRRSSLGS
jgi:hypothetical protein